MRTVRRVRANMHAGVWCTTCAQPYWRTVSQYASTYFGCAAQQSTNQTGLVLYLDEIVDLIWDELELRGSEDSIRRSLKACDWSTKKTQRVARERDAELRDACLEELSEYKSYSIALAVGLLVCRAPRRRPRRWAGNETLAVADGHLLSAIRT